jgi:hypothetical protein
LEMPVVHKNFKKFVFTFTITIASTNLGGDAIECRADASVIDRSGRGIFNRQRRCNQQNCNQREVRRVYSLFLAFVHPSLRSSEPGHFRLRHQPTAGSLGLPTRTSTQTVGAIRVPANGATTPEAVKRNDMTIDGHWSRGLVFVTL